MARQPLTVDQLADAVANRLDYDRLAECIVNRLRATGPERVDGLVDVAIAARILGVSTSTVYRHAEELGARRVGTGARAPLRFDPERLRRNGHG